MPTRELDPYIANLPRIQAGRSLVAAQEIAVGMGRMKESDHRATLDGWRRELTAGEPATRRDPATLAAAARAAGIGVRTVSR